jgi:hypothetical protein
MKTPLRAASAILAATTVAFATATTSFAACDPATRALQYLATQQKADGSLNVPAFGNPGATEDFAMGAAALNYDPNSVVSSGGKSLYDYLATRAGTGTGDASTDAGKTAKMLLALAAGNVPSGHYDYHAFGGQDLLGKLTADTPTGFYHPTGSSAGSYGSGDTFSQSLAVLALRATGTPVPPAALTYLEGLQNTGNTTTGYSGEPATDHGWSYLAAKDAAEADTNSSAIALQALESAGDTTGVAAAITWLHTQQNSDAGFPYQLPCGYAGCEASDPTSTANVLQALKAAGESLGGWTKSGATPLDRLLQLQDPATGGFPTGSPDAFTTSQMPYGLGQVAFPVPPPPAGAGLPAAGCPAAAVMVTTSASPQPALPRAGAASREGPPALPLGVTAGILALSGGISRLRRSRRQR